MSCTSRQVGSALDWTKAVVLGTLGNSIIGGLTGFIGSIILQRNPPTAVALWWIGCLAGVIGGLLHALVIFIIVHCSRSNVSTSDLETRSFGRECLKIFTHAPCWSILGATLSYLTLVGNPWDLDNSLTLNLPFTMVLLTALAGTLGIAIYATLMSWWTGSDDHLLILQNTVILMADDILRQSMLKDLEDGYEPLLQDPELLLDHAKVDL